MPGAYLFPNLIDDDAVLTPSSEDSAYPVENIYDSLVANVFRGESPTALTIEIDFGAPVTADTIAIMNHNLTSGATIALLNGDESPAAAIASLSYRESDIWKAFSSTTAQIWVLSITDSNSENLQIGQVVLGVRVAFPIGRRIAEGYSPSTKRAGISGETYGGVKWNYHLHQEEMFNPSFRCRSAADLAIFKALDRLVYGDLKPFVYIPDTAGADCYFVRKEIDFGPVEVARVGSGSIVYDYQLTLAEESRGLDIQA